jgi:DNA-binding transcriptional ArsR family regulator
MFGWVLAHPIRCRALTILARREASPVEIGRELGMDASHVAYHLRILYESGLIELTDEVPRRGSIEHLYKGVHADGLTERQCPELPSAERAVRARNTWCFATAEANCALGAGSFLADHRIDRRHMDLDRTGWAELCSLHEDTKCEADRIEAEAAGRLADAGVRGIVVSAFNTFFAMPLHAEETG